MLATSFFEFWPETRGINLPYNELTTSEVSLVVPVCLTCPEKLLSAPLPAAHTPAFPLGSDWKGMARAPFRGAAAAASLTRWSA